jgi:hypothetical protein
LLFERSRIQYFITVMRFSPEWGESSPQELILIGVHNRQAARLFEQIFLLMLCHSTAVPRMRVCRPNALSTITDLSNAPFARLWFQSVSLPFGCRSSIDDGTLFRRRQKYLPPWRRFTAAISPFAINQKAKILLWRMNIDKLCWTLGWPQGAEKVTQITCQMDVTDSHKTE